MNQNQEMQMSRRRAVRVPCRNGRDGLRRAGWMVCVMGSMIPALLWGEGDYTVSVPQGETWKWSQVEASVGSETDGKRLVKEGLGVLAPGEDLSAKGFTALVVNDGVYNATALSQFPTVDSTATLTVADGATLRIGFSLNQAKTFIEITVGGSGAEGEGGAIVFAANTDMGAKYSPNWTLTSDTVFYLDSAGRQVDFSCNGWGAADTHNLFRMNGYALRFRGSTSASQWSWYRFRTGPTIIDPGEMVFDNCRFTRYNSGSMRVWKSADDHSAGTIPLIRLENGARCNFGCTSSSQWLANVAAIDAEHGTEIGDIGVSTADFPGTYTINRLIGSPKILGSGEKDGMTFEHRPLIKSYVVRAEDILQGHALTAASNLNFTAETPISIDDGARLEKGKAYVVATVADEVLGQVTGGDDFANPTHLMAARVDGKDVKLAWESDFVPAEDEFSVFVPDGSSCTWEQATSDVDLSQASGKKLVKIGRGTLTQGGGETAGCTELVVARGVYVVSDSAELPVKDGAMKVTVRDGATFWVSLGLDELTSESRCLDVHLSGNGHFDGSNRLGAFCFAHDSFPRNQWCRWTLDGDALITLLASQANFSADSLKRSDDWNVWDMNGHGLTLHSIFGSNGLFRFRSGPTIRNPGNITLDGAKFSMYNGAAMKVEGDALIPVFKTVNGCTVNFANTDGGGPYLNQCAALCDFGPGTVMDHVAVHPTDVPGPTVISNMIGTLTVSAAQALTVAGRYTVRKDDLLAEPFRILVSETNLAFARGSTIAVDDLSGLDLDSGLTIAKCPRGMLSGRPKREGEFSVRVERAEDGDYLRLRRRGRFFMVIR